MDWDCGMHPSGSFCVDWNSILSETWEDGVDGLTLEFRGSRSLAAAEKLESAVQQRNLGHGNPDVELEWHSPVITPRSVVVSLCGPPGADGSELMHWLWVVSQSGPGKEVWVTAAERHPRLDIGSSLALAFVPIARDNEDGPSRGELDDEHLTATTELLVSHCTEVPGDLTMYDFASDHRFPVEPEARNWLAYHARRGRRVGLAVADDDNQVSRSATFDAPLRLSQTRPPHATTMATLQVAVGSDRTAALQVLLQRLPTVAARSHQAFIKPLGGSVHPDAATLFYRPKPPITLSPPTLWMPDHPHLIPDVHGIQVLTDRQMLAAANLADWDVTEIAPDRHLVQARDLDDWLQPGGPPPDVLDAARAAFGPELIRMSKNG